MHNCTCDRCREPQHECREPERLHRREFTCPRTQEVIKHCHVVKHRHDIINEFDVVHEHEINERDVVREREVVTRNDCTHHIPEYCNREDCGCERPFRRNRVFGRLGRRW